MKRNFNDIDGYRFDALAIYNSECSRGIVHTVEHKREMKNLQSQYDQEIRHYCKKEGILQIVSGIYPNNPKKETQDENRI